MKQPPKLFEIMLLHAEAKFSAAIFFLSGMTTSIKKVEISDMLPKLHEMSPYLVTTFIGVSTFKQNKALFKQKENWFGKQLLEKVDLNTKQFEIFITI